jgi:hypothetical protein
VQVELAEYDALVEKVTQITSAIETRRSADLACRPGCHDCCRVELDLLPVEAARVAQHLRSLDEASRQAIRARAGAIGACVMLDAEGVCSIYPARPIVCRTEGHALDHPSGLIPEDAIRARAHGDVTWCPLNYVEAMPGPDDVLTVERLETLLFVVNRRFAAQAGTDPEKRTPLRDLARGV